MANEKAAKNESFTERRNTVVERRMGMEKRVCDQGREEGDQRMGMDRRIGPGVRRSAERKSAEEGNMNDEQFDFLMAIDEYKRSNRKPFPSWTEVLEVIKALGYRKVAEAQSIDAFREENSLEPVHA
jgi:hypothetical protein